MTTPVKHVAYTPFFQPAPTPSAKHSDHNFASQMDRLREMIANTTRTSQEKVDLQQVRRDTGARKGSLYEMSQCITEREIRSRSEVPQFSEGKLQSVA